MKFRAYVEPAERMKGLEVPRRWYRRSAEASGRG
jgi:hypothetical protein